MKLNLVTDLKYLNISISNICHNMYNKNKSPYQEHILELEQFVAV